MDPVIVIGAGLAGWTAVREFRKLDARTPVIVVASDSADFYAKPALSNAFSQGKNPAQLVTTPATRMAETLDVTLMPDTHVHRFDPAGKTLQAGNRRLGWSRLVLATGARPIRAPMRGDAGEEILSVNSLADFRAFHARLRPGATIAIMGAGLIGCEFANDLGAAGFKVHVFDPGPRPLAALLPEALGNTLRDALARLGVQWHFGTGVVAVHSRVGADGAPLEVETSTGHTLAAHAVLSAIGLRADTALAQDAGVACGRGIIVDKRLMTSAPDVYALGDCAQYASAANRTLPFVMPIMSAARVLAINLAGGDAALVFPPMPVAVKTPVLPIVVASPAPDQQGQWNLVEQGIWQFHDQQGLSHGFALGGSQTARRAEQMRALSCA